jgi:hypothetical protein
LRKEIFLEKAARSPSVDDTTHQNSAEQLLPMQSINEEKKSNFLSDDRQEKQIKNQISK